MISSTSPRLRARRWRIAAYALLGVGGCARGSDSPAPPALRGAFVDDYGTHHQIDDTLWVHGPANRYHVVQWDTTARFLIALNDSSNAADAGRYDRIDWVLLPGDDEWRWAFCIVTWNAASAEIARATASADTTNPRSGCAGYPFTRMRPALAPVDSEERDDEA